MESAEIGEITMGITGMNYAGDRVEASLMYKSDKCIIQGCSQCAKVQDAVQWCLRASPPNPD